MTITPRLCGMPWHPTPHTLHLSVMVADQLLLDDSAIDRLRGFGGDKLLRGMIELFVKNAPNRAAEAREALDCGDAAGLRAALHGLKSSAGQLGAMTVHHACNSGEELASRGELNACVAHVERIESDLPLACSQLEGIRSAS
jgi:HPt (histidine-containing phosphotransfer) domain-containing protein